MNVSTIGALLLELVPAIVILGEDKRIIWFGGQFDDYFLIKQGELFTQIFSITARDLNRRQVTISTPRGKKFSLRPRPLELENERLTILLIDELTDVINNKDSKIACLEKIIDCLDEGVIVSDFEGRLALYTKAQEKLEGLKASNTIGKYLWEVYNYNPDMSEHRHVFKTKHPIINQYQAHAYVSGLPQYVRYSTYPVIKDGETIGVISVSTNETDLQSLLHETIEIKRQLFSNDKESKEQPRNGAIYSFDTIKGTSLVIRNLIKEAQTIALRDSDILLVGETGTGKELFAQSIHNYSNRSLSPFVAINCAAIPETLLESTLFGTVRGAYTGAADQTGLFEFAKDGTLFLDEINSMPLSLQAKLTRVLEERVMRRLGTTTVTPVRCRVISSSNEEPRKLGASNKLRPDLYYRIAHSCLIIPALRERREDILYLMNYFIAHFSKEFNTNISGMTDELREFCLQYSWPGNVRELKHVVENMIMKLEDQQEILDTVNLPLNLRSNVVKHHTPGNHQNSEQRKLFSAVNTFEKEYLRDILEKNNWNLTNAAKSLGIARQNLQYYIKKFKLK